MHNPERNPSPTLWAASPTAKQKNAASRNVSQLLDALAPQQAVRRAEPPKLRIERYRTPEGAVLQAAHAALTLSWFAEATEASALGELRILVWKGIVARRGTTPARERATVTGELMLRPSENPDALEAWIGSDGTTYDTASLTAHCLALLERQIERPDQTDPSPVKRSA